MENYKKISKKYILVLFCISSILSIQGQSFVGTQIEVNNTDQGGLQCRIPLSLPSGGAGLTPELSIVYNSQSHSGIIGNGWDLGGLSAIVRTPKNLYYDGKISAITLDTFDRFSLDGQRLLVTNKKQYGNESCIYGTEEESFVRITSKNYSYHVPQYFIATMDNGNVARYQASEMNAKLHWYIDSLADKNGNYIRYHFKSENNFLRIDSIAYTGNHFAGIKPYNKIEFLYDTCRDFNNIRYVAQMEIIQKFLLKEIVIKSQDEIVRRYQLKYENFNNSFPRLIQVLEIGSDNKPFKPIKLEYLYNNSEFQQWKDEGFKITSPVQRLMCGNFYSSDTTTFIRARLYEGKILYGDKNEKGGIIGPWQHPAGGNYLAVTFNAFTCDIDANHSDEILFNVAISTKNNSIYDKGMVYWCRYENNGGKNQWTARQLQENTNPNQVVFGNFDDNPLLDYIFVKDGKLYVHPNFCDSRYTASATTISISEYDKLESVDINGDGVLELMVIPPSNGGRVYKNANSVNINFQILNCDIPYFSFNQNNRFHVYFGDVNGDGISDMIRPLPKRNWIPEDTIFWSVNLGTGNGFSSVVYSSSIRFYPTHSESTSLQLLDLNGDGCDDFIVGSDIKGLNSYTAISAYISNSFCLTNMMLREFHTTKIMNSTFNLIAKENMMNVPYCYTDINNDGIVDFTCVHYKEGDLIGVISKKYPMTLLNKITDTWGNIYTITYEHKNLRPAFNGKVNKIHHGQKTNVVLLKNIKLTKNDEAKTIIFNKHFTYNSSVYNYNKRAFLGFLNIQTIDSIQAYQEVSTYEYNSSFQRVLPKTYKKTAIASKNILNNNIIHNYTYTNAIQGLTNGLTKTYQSAINLIDNGISKTMTTSIDISSGRISKTTSAYNGQWKEETSFTYGESALADGRKLTKVVQEKHWKQIANTLENNYLKDTTYYIYNNGDPIVVQTRQDGQMFTTRFDYDFTFGVLKSKSIGSTTSKSEFYDYDSLKRFVTVKRTLYNFTEFWDYDCWGNILTYTDINNNTTSYDYDGFRRIKNIYYPDGVHEHFTYSMDNLLGIDIADIKYSIMKRRNNTIVSIAYFDALLNEILTKNINSFVRKKYDIKGRLIAVSYPFIASKSPTDWHTYTYNAMDLLQTEISPFVYNQYNYQCFASNNTIKTSINDKLRETISTKTVLANGLVDKIEIDVNGDNYNVTSFSYSAEKVNNISVMKTSIVTNNASSTSIFTDFRNRQIKTVDSDAGTTNSSYNDFDELVAHTDANNITAYYTYDSISRVTSIAYDDGSVIEYTYDSNNCKGTLSKEVFNNNAIEYFYDSLARILRKTYIVDNLNFTYNYAYDNLGRLNQIVYPNNIKINYLHNSYDQLEEIKLNDESIYKIITRDARYLKPTSLQLGKNHGKAFTFNHLGQLTENVCKKGKTNIIFNNNNQHYQEVNSAKIEEVKLKNNKQKSFLSNSASMNLPTSFTFTDTTIFEKYYYYNLFIPNRLSSISENKPINLPSEQPINAYDTKPFQSEEYFRYDNLDRLTTNERNIVRDIWIASFDNPTNGHYVKMDGRDTLQKLQYDKTKMIENSAVGAFSYDNKSHAINSVQPINDSVISPATCNIAYNVFNKTQTITEDKKRYDITYFPNQQRAMTTYSVNNTEQEKKIYAGVEFEKNLSSNTTYSYIYAGNEPIAVYIQNDSNKLYYLHSVLNGSISYITDTEGNKVDTLSYTPFGQRRLFSDWSKTDTAKHLIDRGFTGQQHLDEFALINFNGRMYDPVLAHFLSPDPYIQSPENPLNHNRYSYCLFSPLQYVDPTGLLIDEWEVNINGKIKWVRESKTHVLYSVDANGDRTGEFVVLKNRDILDQLVESGKQNKYNLSFAIGSESDQTDMIKAFKFLADHTDVEWRLDRFRNEYGGSDYSIGTSHDADISPSASDMGHSSSSVIALIHSHPNITPINEKASMGFKIGNVTYGDMAVKYNTYPNSLYYMYAPTSGNIWEIRNYGQSPRFIKQTHNYKDFLFGTLNTR